MKKELQEKLFHKYPGLFAQKDLDMSQTCMCWGIDTGDGWYNILNSMCANIIEHYQAKKEECPIQFIQVKEKFGTLRAYTNEHCDEVENFIREAEKETAKTCEMCGTIEDVTFNTKGWHYVRCLSCDKSVRAKYR